ncbi:MAG: ammonium transporter [Rhodoglobus sp.]
MGEIVVVAAVAANLVVLISLAVVDSRMLPAAPWLRSGMLSLASAATGTIAWLALAPLIAPGIAASLYLPIAALAGVAAFLATLTVRGLGAGTLVTLGFGLLWSALVFLPAAVLSFSTLPGPFGLEPVDHGGSLAVNVAGGAAALGVLLAAGSSGGRPRSATVDRSLGIVAVVILSLGWIGWLASAELAFDQVTAGVVLNGIVGALGGAAGWLIVQRIRHQLTTPSAVAAGILAGLVSITAGAPLFTPVSAAAAGLISGAIACAFTLSRLAASRRKQWFIVGSHLVAAAVGLFLLGLLASGVGFTFTGQLSLIQNQVLSAALVAAYSTAVSFLLWLVLKRAVAKSPVRAAEAL